MKTGLSEVTGGSCGEEGNQSWEPAGGRGAGRGDLRDQPGSWLRFQGLRNKAAVDTLTQVSKVPVGDLTWFGQDPEFQRVCPSVRVPTQIHLSQQPALHPYFPDRFKGKGQVPGISISCTESVSLPYVPEGRKVVKSAWKFMLPRCCVFFVFVFPLFSG